MGEGETPARSPSYAGEAIRPPRPFDKRERSSLVKAVPSRWERVCANRDGQAAQMG